MNTSSNGQGTNGMRVSVKCEGRHIEIDDVQEVIVSPVEGLQVIFGRISVKILLDHFRMTYDLTTFLRRLFQI